MFDVFYRGPKPNLFPFEQPAETLESARAQCRTRFFWWLHGDNDYADFDFSYMPPPWQAHFKHIWRDEKDIGQLTYLLDKETPDTASEHWHGKIIDARRIPHATFYIDKFNAYSTSQYQALADKFKNIQKTRLANGMFETIKRCANKADTPLFWILPSDLDYSNFTWQPPDEVGDVIYQFELESEHTFRAYLINRDEFQRHLHWCKSMDELPNIYRVHNSGIQLGSDLYSKFYISRHAEPRSNYARLKILYPDLEFIDASQDRLTAFEQAKNKAKTSMFWAIDSDAEISDHFKFKYHVPDWDESYVHVFSKWVNLIPRDRELSPEEVENDFFYNNKQATQVAGEYMPWDIFFISYNESVADRHWESLRQRYPSATRIHSVPGIVAAHKRAAELSVTEMFYVVDGDAELMPDYAFDFQPPVWDRDAVFVWHSRNPVNDLEYGYGGVKLLPRAAVLDLDPGVKDMTTSISTKFNVVPRVSNITKFNTDPYTTWRAAFRECVKLATGLERQNDDETAHRLDTWCNVGTDRPFGEWAICGARDGLEFASSNTDFAKINNFDWLKEYYEQKYNSKR